MSSDVGCRQFVKSSGAKVDRPVQLVVSPPCWAQLASDHDSGTIMQRQQLEQMSIDELWSLHKQVESILGERLIAKTTQLERRLEQLGHKSDKERPSGK
jgi:hypothetical protein